MRALLFGLVCLFSFPAMAVKCYFTLAKDSCWTNYDVTVQVIDSEANKVLNTLTVPKGTSWMRNSFDCSPNLKLMFSATYSPVFWKNHNARSYPAQDFLSLPATVAPGTSAWEIPICYPAAFLGVPLPPDAKGSCQCDFKSIPPIAKEQS